MHGSNLVKELKKVDPEAEILCWGGDKMEEAGAGLLVHYRELAIMGFWEVLMKLGKILGNLKKCRHQIIEFKPDLVILIDYPGFNLRMAAILKKYGFRVYYYISPKVWAWKKSRIKKIKRFIDRMYVIFPFEKAFFEDNDYKVHYFGNPLVETVEEGMSGAGGRQSLIKKYDLEDKPVIALLAGSRLQEINRILPEMAKMKKHYPAYQFVVAGLKTIDESVYSNILKNNNIRVVYNSTYELLSGSEAALVTSGTATLETAIANIPQLVCYRAGPFSYMIARLLLKIKFISLVNLIMDREVVKELIQDELNEPNIFSELKAILPGGLKRQKMLKDYSVLREMLSPRGASAGIAGDMYNLLKKAANDD